MKSVNKISTLVLWASMIITVVIFGLFYYRYDKQEIIEPGSIMNWIYIILTICVLAVSSFSIYSLFFLKKRNLRTKVSIVICLLVSVVLLVGSYLLSGRDMISTWLYIIYFLLGMTILAMLVGIIWSYVKKTR